MEAVVSRDNMLLALHAVERNKGAAGGDGMTTGQLRGHLREQWEQTKARLLEGGYQPHLVRRVDIPKTREGVMASLKAFLGGKLRLKVNETKSSVTRPWETKFLGYSMTVHRQPRLNVAARSVERFKDKVRQLVLVGRGRNLQRFIEKDLNPVVRGWANYYGKAGTFGVFEELDGWLRRKAAVPDLAALEAGQYPPPPPDRAWFREGPGAALRLEWVWSLVERWSPAHEYRLPRRPPDRWGKARLNVGANSGVRTWFCGSMRLVTGSPMSSSEARPAGPWWRELTGYHWFVFAMASLAWLFDCLDQQLFILARPAAMKALLPAGMDPNKYGAYATAIFVAGWATGGLFFGAVGDRIGRARTLTLTVLLYSVFTGLSALSTGWVDFAAYRFVTGLGVGGVFGLAVALIADSLPDASRTGALGTLQALSAVGNVTAGLISMGVGQLVANQTITANASWKLMFLVGALPAFLCVFLQWRMKEPEKWVRAREEGRRTGAAFGSYASLFGEARWRRSALFGMMLCVSGVIGLWGIGFFAPELVGPVIERSLRDQNLSPEKIAGARSIWIGINSIVFNVGAFFGMLLMTRLAQGLGRRPAFAIAFVLAMVATVGYFRFFNGKQDIWMSAVMGACQLALFAGFAIYLPELFPIRLRSTGTSFCYNVGRFLAASGPITLGKLQEHLKAGALTPEAKIEAFRTATTWMSLIFLLGLVALIFLPETKGRPLPEDLPTGEKSAA